MPNRLPTPHDAMRVWWSLAILGAEAQAVVTMRVLGLWGIWPVTPSERNRMVREKGPAFARAWAAAARAAATGAPPLAIATASMTPLSARARANRRRLVRRIGHRL